MKLVVLRAFGRGSQAAPWDNEESIREELFSIERLEQHAESLAAAQPLGPRDAAAVGARLPACSAADDRGVRGGRDHAGDRARGESSTRSQAHRDCPSRAPGSGRPGRPAPRRERAPGRADPLGLSALRTGTLAGGLRCPARATAAGAGSEGHASSDVARGTPPGTGNNPPPEPPGRAPKRKT